MVGLGILAASIKPDISPSDLALGALFGLGLGLINSQILNLIFSLVKPELMADASGIDLTFEQLGNAIGVALIGTILMGTLMTSAQQDILASTTIPQEAKVTIINSIEDGMQLVSDQEIEAGLEKTQLDETISQEILEIYDLARTQAFKAGAALLAFFALLGLVLSFRLPKHKLVGGSG